MKPKIPEREPNKHQLREYWINFMKSAHHTISRGAENIFKIITKAHNENWRRKEKKK